MAPERPAVDIVRLSTNFEVCALAAGETLSAYRTRISHAIKQQRNDILDWRVDIYERNIFVQEMTAVLKRLETQRKEKVVPLRVAREMRECELGLKSAQGNVEEMEIEVAQRTISQLTRCLKELDIQFRKARNVRRRQNPDRRRPFVPEVV